MSLTAEQRELAASLGRERLVAAFTSMSPSQIESINLLLATAQGLIERPTTLAEVGQLLVRTTDGDAGQRRTAGVTPLPLGMTVLQALSSTTDIPLTPQDLAAATSWKQITPSSGVVTWTFADGVSIVADIGATAITVAGSAWNQGVSEYAPVLLALKQPGTPRAIIFQEPQNPADTSETLGIWARGPQGSDLELANAWVFARLFWVRRGSLWTPFLETDVWAPE
jgi:hypothetical protein